MKLLIVSHTEHFVKDGKTFGFGPTVMEINYLVNIFDSITHIAPLYEAKVPKIALSYDKGVKFIPIRPTGGKKFLDKLKILIYSIQTFRTVRDELRNADLFQFRAPTGIGIYLIPYLGIIKKRGWFKYAGNWIQNDPPLGYRLQRFYLNRIFKSKNTTINGSWPFQKSHTITFENPCITDDELEYGKEVMLKKKFNSGINLLFVGRIEKEKGINLFLKSLKYLPEYLLSWIGKVVIVGNGRNYNELKHKFGSDSKICFVGELSRKELNEYYIASHFLFLPSASEGFPKVVAEAACYGCIPCVSQVSAICQYVNNGNGLLLSDLDPVKIAEKFTKLLKNEDLNKLSYNAWTMSKLFTFSRYITGLKSKIIGSQVTLG